MSFVERLKQELALEAQLAEQKAAQEKADQEVRAKARLQAEAIEKERRAQRRQQAEKFREESGVDNVLEELIKFLETPTIKVTRSSYSDGLWSAYTEYIGRGRRGLSGGSVTFLKDPDSVCDIASWDTVKCGSTQGKDRDEHFAEKRVAVETRPDGVIIFHGGWGGSTTIKMAEWRTNNREVIFDKALEKAFKNPATHRFSVHHPADYSIKM